MDEREASVSPVSQAQSRPSTGRRVPTTYDHLSIVGRIDNAVSSLGDNSGGIDHAVSSLGDNSANSPSIPSFLSELDTEAEFVPAQPTLTLLEPAPVTVPEHDITTSLASTSRQRELPVARTSNSPLLQALLFNGNVQEPPQEKESTSQPTSFREPTRTSDPGSSLLRPQPMLPQATSTCLQQLSDLSVKQSSWSAWRSAEESQEPQGSSGASPEHVHMQTAVLELPQEPIDLSPRPYVVIIEQPSSKARFRYLTEILRDNRCTGLIPGENSTQDHNTCPTIKILYHPYKHALIIAMCITDKKPYIAHAHQLFGGSIQDGVRIVGGMVVAETTRSEFSLSKVGIMRVVNAAKWQSLQDRKMIRMPQLPTRHIYTLSDSMNPEASDMKVVRLAFQVFTRENDQQDWKELATVVTNPIYNELSGAGSEAAALPIQIDEAIPIVGSTDGGTVMVICLAKKQKFQLKLSDLEVIFYEENNHNGSQWSEYAYIRRTEGRIMVLHTPPYQGNQAATDGRVEVKFQIRCRRREHSSEPITFYYEQNRLLCLPPHVTPPPEIELEITKRTRRDTDDTDKVSQEARATEKEYDGGDSDSDNDSDSDEDNELMNHFGNMKL